MEHITKLIGYTNKVGPSMGELIPSNELDATHNSTCGPQHPLPVYQLSRMKPNLSDNRPRDKESAFLEAIRDQSDWKNSKTNRGVVWLKNKNPN